MAKQQKRFDCLPFPSPVNNSSPQRKKVKQTTVKQYEEESRTRKFLPVWRENYPWQCFNSDNNKMYCQVCLKCPDIADRTGSFFVGMSSFRLTSNRAHHESRTHWNCVDAGRARDNPVEASLHKVL